MVSWSRALWWNTVGNCFFIPMGEQPPWTYPVRGEELLAGEHGDGLLPHRLGGLLQVQGSRHRDVKDIVSPGGPFCHQGFEHLGRVDPQILSHRHSVRGPRRPRGDRCGGCRGSSFGPGPRITVGFFFFLDMWFSSFLSRGISPPPPLAFPLGADSPCQGEMSRSDRGDRERCPRRGADEGTDFGLGTLYAGDYFAACGRRVSFPAMGKKPMAQATFSCPFGAIHLEDPPGDGSGWALRAHIRLTPDPITGTLYS